MAHSVLTMERVWHFRCRSQVQRVEYDALHVPAHAFAASVKYSEFKTWAGYDTSAAAAKHGESKTMLFSSKPCTLAATSSTAS